MPHSVPLSHSFRMNHESNSGSMHESRAPLLRNGLGMTQQRLKAPVKRRFLGFGFLPLWSECVPLSGPDRLHGPPDWGAVGVNVVAGLIMGLREALGGVISASMIFSSTDVPEISSMLQFGISMTLYTMTVGILWYAFFGRLQYGYGTQQDLICILQAQLAVKVANRLQLAGAVEKIPATVFATICLSAVLTGIVSIVVGKLAWGTAMLMIPKPVVSGFLGGIGVVVMQAGLNTASSVKFHHLWPDTGWSDFCSSQDRLWQVGCMFGHAAFIILGPMLLHTCLRTKRHPARKLAVTRYAGLICQLLPLVLFYAVVHAYSVSMGTLEDRGWTFPANKNHGSIGPLGLWTTYKPADVDVDTVLHVLCSDTTVALVAMAILCTMLGALAITGRFGSGPDGDPAPYDLLDFNAELTTVGAASVFLGLTGGNLIFHKFAVMQLREDGGTHRIAVLTIALVAGALLLFDLPVGSYVPKWFLGGLFVNTGWSFLNKTLLSYRTLAGFDWRGLRLVSPQYGISTCCVCTALFYSPTVAILAAIALSVLLYLIDGISASPVSNVVDGSVVVSRTKRPWWEMQALIHEGDRIRLLYMQGLLFFGSTFRLTSNLTAAAASDRIQFIILSFARVTLVDPSAADNLRRECEKMRRRGCHVIFCRMNEQVFATLRAAGVVWAVPEKYLDRVRQLGWRCVEPTPVQSRGVDGKPPGHAYASVLNAYTPLQKTRAHPFPNVGAGDAANEGAIDGAEHPDVFFHETDALDYCNSRVVGKFCYEVPSPGLALEGYMTDYLFATLNPGSRLSERAFEMMNDLPSGVMAQLRPCCDVHDQLPPGFSLTDELPTMERALCFILKGALSLVQVIPVVDQTQARPRSTTFTFRAGKRLLVRYPPGHVAGGATFFKFHQQQTDTSQKLIVSSHLNPPAEIWVLRYEGHGTGRGWKQMPDDLKGYLARMLCVQFSDVLNHANLKER